jgi:hypothetical protein
MSDGSMPPADAFDAAGAASADAAGRSEDREHPHEAAVTWTKRSAGLMRFIVSPPVAPQTFPHRSAGDVRLVNRKRSKRTLRPTARRSVPHNLNEPAKTRKRREYAGVGVFAQAEGDPDEE